VFHSDRSGSLEIWVCDVAGHNLLQWTSIGGRLTGTPRWAPDSRHVAFDSRAGENSDIYVMLEGGAPRRITSEASDDVVPSWSSDRRWIYFSSNRTGRWGSLENQHGRRISGAGDDVTATFAASRVFTAA
jgi:Tol biopolymer transport system component